MSRLALVDHPGMPVGTSLRGHPAQNHPPRIDVQAVAVLVNVQGRLVAMESLPNSNQRWWEQLAPTEGLVLNRMQTPFAMLYFDDYEAIKPK